MSRSTRWCPTPEQLMTLEELYKGGLRTPKAYQIQKITAHLSLYGKIEGKNVFYWFQNHKARDRQKLRRKLMSKQLGHQQLLQEQLYQHQHHYNLHNRLQPLNSYSSSALHQLPCYISDGCVHQGRVEDASPIVRDYMWKVDNPRTCEMDNHMNRTYGHDWRMMMMMDVGPAIPSCPTNRPLETLSLFPTTATSLKDQSTAI